MSISDGQGNLHFTSDLDTSQTECHPHDWRDC